MTARRAALAAALACNPPATGEPAPAPPAEAAPPASTCEEPSPGALALLPAEPAAELADRACPWVLVGSGDELRARPLARADGSGLRAALPVLPPVDCRPCRFSGVVTTVGPVLLATRPSAGSELADAAWLGVAGSRSPDAGPTPVVFAPLWFGQPGFGDSTLQGPPWALVPHLCGAPRVAAGPQRPAPPAPADRSSGPAAPPGPTAPRPVPESPALVLLAEPRLPGARAEEPPPALVRAAGVYAAAEVELVRLDTSVPSDMSMCTRVPLELP